MFLKGILPEKIPLNPLHIPKGVWIASTGTTHLDTVSFPVKVTENKIFLLLLGRYLLPLIIDLLNKYLFRGSRV